MSQGINNAIYDELGERWYLAEDDPIALLRAESRHRTPWVESQLERHIPGVPAEKKILDVGCGAGFLSNELAAQGYNVTGIDVSGESLRIAREFDASRSVKYLEADARMLPFADASFDAVTAMDFLEHVEEPALVIKEMARVLRPGGVFFAHTFNRTFLSWLIIIKGVELFVKNTPPNLHLHRMFIKPKELENYLKEGAMTPLVWEGVQPAVFSRPFLRLLFTGKVSPEFSFQSAGHLQMGYYVSAIKN